MWRSVTDECQAAWRSIFDRPAVGHRVEGACLVCGHSTLHRYFMVGRPLEVPRAGFSHRGAVWEWCASCGTYEHASALVPDGWCSDLDVDVAALTAEPDALQRALGECIEG